MSHKTKYKALNLTHNFAVKLYIKYMLNVYKQPGGLIKCYIQRKVRNVKGAKTRCSFFGIFINFIEKRALRKRAPPSGLCRHNQSVIHTWADSTGRSRWNEIIKIINCLFIMPPQSLFCAHLICDAFTGFSIEFYCSVTS